MPLLKTTFGMSGTQSALLALIYIGVLTARSPSLADTPDTYRVVKSIPLKVPFATRSDWTLTAYQEPRPADTSDTGNVPAKLCFSRSTDKSAYCTKITSGVPNLPNFLYHYQTVKRLEIAPLNSRVKAIIFQAEFFGGGSGMAEQISIWTYDREGDSFVPALIISTNQSGRYKIINTGPLAGYVITADPEWQAGESHYGAHQFEITAYRLSDGSYLKVLTFLSVRKYGGEDEGPGDPIGGEMTKTRTLLKAIGQ